MTQRSKAVARIEPLTQPRRRALRGDMKGKIWMSDDFFEPLDCFKDYLT